MRRSSLEPLLLVLLAVTGCKQEVMTGPAPQAAFEDATTVAQAVPENVVIFVDGERITDDGDIARVADVTGPTAEEVVRIEVLKGEAARELVSDKPVRSVVQIYTTRAES